MRTLRRNRVPFWYCTYLGKEELIDEDGNKTGDYYLRYAKPVQLWGNVSPARGEAQMELFGNDIAYDKTIILDDPDCPITESSVLFVDKEPEFTPVLGLLLDSSGQPILTSDNEPIGAVENLPLFDYIVKRAARSLNSVSFAIERVTVT